MKRTPRSASRRASRQLAANEPSPPFVPYRSRTVCGSLREVDQLGHARLHLERHLVLADRASRSRGRRPRPAGCWLRAVDGVDHVALLRRRRRPSGLRGRAPGRPWSGTGRPGTGWAGSRCATAARRSAASGRRGPCDVSTTKPGRSSASRPEAVPEPRAHAGRPEIWVPVFMKVWAGSWLICLGLHRADDADLVGDRRRCAGRASRSPGPTCRTC